MFTTSSCTLAMVHGLTAVVGTTTALQARQEKDELVSTLVRLSRRYEVDSRSVPYDLPSTTSSHVDLSAKGKDGATCLSDDDGRTNDHDTTRHPERPSSVNDTTPTNVEASPKNRSSTRSHWHVEVDAFQQPDQCPAHPASHVSGQARQRAGTCAPKRRRRVAVTGMYHSYVRKHALSPEYVVHQMAISSHIHQLTCDLIQTIV